MATLSGNFDTNGYGGKHLNFSWSGTQSIGDNYTDVAWTLKGAGGSGYHMAGDFTVIIDGETVYSSATRIQLFDGTVVASGTKRIYHNTNGTKSFSASVSASIYTFAVDKTGSGSWELNTIPRYTSITSFSVAKRNETSFIFNWSTSDIIDYLWYSINNGSNWTGVDVTDGTSGNITVNGLNANTTYNCKIRVRRKDSQLTTDSNTVSQTTYKVPTNSINSYTENTIKVNWGIDSTADYIWYSKDNGSNWTAVGSVNATSGTYEITGLSANTTYNIKTRVRRKSSQTSYDTATLQQATYDYPKPTDSRSFIIGAGASEPNNVEAGASVCLYNPLGRNCKLEIISKVSNTEIGSYSGTHNGWVIGELRNSTAVNKQYASIPNAQSGTYYAKVTYGSIVRTYDVNNTYSITGGEKPTFNNFTYKDINSAVTGVTGNDQILVKGLSNLQATISSANKMIGNYSANGKSYTATIDTLSKSVNYSTSDLNINIGTITNSGTKRLNITAYDTRNLSKVVYKDITVMDYSKPVINVILTRLNNFEAQTTLKVNGTYTRLTINNEDKNVITNVQYRYRETNGTWNSWTTLNTVITTGKFTCSDVILSLDNTKSFEFEIRAVDKLQTNTLTKNLDIGQAIFFISSNNKKCYINGDEIVTLNKLNKYIVDSANYVVTPNVDITKDYNGSGTYLQQQIPLNTPWGNRHLDKNRYFKLRIIYIQNSNYTYPWDTIVVGRVQGGDSWSKRLGVQQGTITKATDYNIYEAIIGYNATEMQNTYLNFIWEHFGCGCTLKYIEFYEVTPLFI